MQHLEPCEVLLYLVAFLGYLLYSANNLLETSQMMSRKVAEATARNSLRPDHIGNDTSPSRFSRERFLSLYGHLFL